MLRMHSPTLLALLSRCSGLTLHVLFLKVRSIRYEGGMAVVVLLCVCGSSRMSDVAVVGGGAGKGGVQLNLFSPK